VFITSSSLPLFPFHNVIGKFVTTITVPTTPLPGQSTEFADVYAQITDNLINGQFALELSDMEFIFDDQSKTMVLRVYLLRDGQTFMAHYLFSYAINDSNIATFNLVDEDGNANAIEVDMVPFLSYLVTDVFKLDYYTVVSPVLGQFTSQDHPGFSFTGNLR
jgi:hypothetical protein